MRNRLDHGKLEDEPIKTIVDSEEIGQFLQEYPGLRLLPVSKEKLRIAGTIDFSAEFKGFEMIQDSFEIEISVPEGYPYELPSVRVTDGRIPNSFHTNPDGSLCLGSPTRIRLILVDDSSLLTFTNILIIPYLYNFSYFIKNSVLPIGQLNHDKKGIIEDYADLFCVGKADKAIEMVRMASIKKRRANKYPCPCGKGTTLGKCHNRIVNGFREKLGRSWFLKEYRYISGK